MDKKSLRACHYNRIDIKSKVNRFARIRSVLLWAFVVSMPFSTYLILRNTLLSSDQSLIKSVYTDEEDESAYPTAIPWIENAKLCQKSGRLWQNDQCWDKQHNSSF